MSRYVSKTKKAHKKTVSGKGVTKKTGQKQARKQTKKKQQKQGMMDKALTALAKKLKRANATTILKMSIPYVMFGYFGNKMAYAYHITEEEQFFNRLLGSLANLGIAFQNFLPSFHLLDLLVGVLVGIGMRLLVYFKGKNAKKFRKGVEYGSARWATQKDIEPFIDMDDDDNNIILTATERLRVCGRPKNPIYERNRNVLVIGGSGSGKTRFFVKPNIMQLHSSYVVTDPKGYILVGQL